MQIRIVDTDVSDNEIINIWKKKRRLRKTASAPADSSPPAPPRTRPPPKRTAPPRCKLSGGRCRTVHACIVGLWHDSGQFPPATYIARPATIGRLSDVWSFGPKGLYNKQPCVPTKKEGTLACHPAHFLESVCAHLFNTLIYASGNIVSLFIFMTLGGPLPEYPLHTEGPRQK